jgi:hypothetical protein
MGRFKIIILAILLGTLLVACGTSLDTSDNAQTTALPVSSAVLTPTPAKVPLPTSNPAIHVYLGSSIDEFKQAYGSSSSSSGIHYSWKGQNEAWLSVTIDDYEENGPAYDVTQYFNAPFDTSGKHNVSLDIAKSACEKFKPSDSQLLRTEINTPQDRASGIQYIYKSQALANQLDPMWFYADADGEPNVPVRNTRVDPGIYTLFYIGDTTKGYEQCFLTTGINWPF